MERDGIGLEEMILQPQYLAKSPTIVSPAASCTTPSRSGGTIAAIRTIGWVFSFCCSWAIRSMERALRVFVSADFQSFFPIDGMTERDLVNRFCNYPA